MSPLELVIALAFLALAVRSGVYWARHRFGGDDATDDLLFAAFVTGRVGTWLLASGMFYLFGRISVRGRAYTDEASQYAWLLLVFLGLGAMQLLSAWFLGARGARDETDETDETAALGDDDAEERAEPTDVPEPPSRLL